MLARREIEVGKYYVNEDRQRAREVLQVDQQTVHFSTYDLETGKLCGAPYRRCTRTEIIAWADREATVTEADKLQRDELEALFRTHGPDTVKLSPELEATMAGLREEARRTSLSR